MKITPDMKVKLAKFEDKDNYEKNKIMFEHSFKLLHINITAYPDYVEECPCEFTREYMKKKIDERRYKLIQEILEDIQNRPVEIKYVEFNGDNL